MIDAAPRFEEIDPSTYSDKQRDVVARVAAARGRVPAPFKVWMHSERLADALEGLGSMLNTQSTLSEKEFELAIVLIAQHWESPFVIDAHLRFLRRCGADERFLKPLAAGGMPEGMTERERAIYDIVKSFTNISLADDRTFDHAVAHLGRDGLAELIAFVGYYTSVALAMKIHRQPVSQD